MSPMWHVLSGIAFMLFAYLWSDISMTHILLAVMFSVLLDLDHAICIYTRITPISLSVREAIKERMFRKAYTQYYSRRGLAWDHMYLHNLIFAILSTSFGILLLRVQLYHLATAALASSSHIALDFLSVFRDYPMRRHVAFWVINPMRAIRREVPFQRST